MDNATFVAAQAKIFSDASLPQEFHSFVSFWAWDLGHAYGFEEVLNHTRTITVGLMIPCQKYAERLTNSP